MRCFSLQNKISNPGESVVTLYLRKVRLNSKGFSAPKSLFRRSYQRISDADFGGNRNKANASHMGTSLTWTVAE